MRNLFYAFSALLIISCTSVEKQKEVSEDVQGLSLRQTISPNVRANLKVPSEYRQIDPDIYLQAVDESNMSESDKLEFQIALQQIKFLPPGSDIFLDSLSNMIWLHNIDGYAKLDQETSSQLVGMLKKNARQEWSMLGIQGRFGEAYVKQSGNASFMCLPITILDSNGVTSFHSEYIIQKDLRLTRMGAFTDKPVNFDQVAESISFSDFKKR